MIGISACLGGVFCRYDGKSQEVASLRKLVETQQAIMVCPEVMGGLSIPRKPSEIIGGDGFSVWENRAKVMNSEGEDVTEAFKKGSIQAYEKLKAQKIDTLVLKENSPSCGSHSIYDGSFSGNKTAGAGVATAYFLLQGMTVYSESQWLERQGGIVTNGD